MFKWFFRKKEVEQIKEETKKGFESVKKDITSVSGWIKHLNSEKEIQKREIKDIKEVLSSIQSEIDGLKNIFSMMNQLKSKPLFQTNKQLSNKQTAVYAVQTGVQTAVQTPNFEQFSITEKAILWIILNTDMKLGYEDLSKMLGKSKSTIRGQINNIKQKSEGLIKEIVERNGKKRIFIPENVKEKILKKPKVRINNNKKTKKVKDD